jgi:hypothetical protein
MNDLKARAVLLQLRFRDSNINLKLHVGLLNSKLDQSPHFLRPLRPAIAMTIYILTLGCLILSRPFMSISFDPSETIYIRRYNHESWMQTFLVGKRRY